MTYTYIHVPVPRTDIGNGIKASAFGAAKFRAWYICNCLGTRVWGWEHLWAYSSVLSGTLRAEICAEWNDESSWMTAVTLIKMIQVVQTPQFRGDQFDHHLQGSKANFSPHIQWAPMFRLQTLKQKPSVGIFFQEQNTNRTFGQMGAQSCLSPSLHYEMWWLQYGQSPGMTPWHSSRCHPDWQAELPPRRWALERKNRTGRQDQLWGGCALRQPHWGEFLGGPGWKASERGWSSDQSISALAMVIV